MALLGSKTSHGVRSVDIGFGDVWSYGPAFHFTPRSGVRVPMGREDVFRIYLGIRMALSVGAPLALWGGRMSQTRHYTSKK